MIKNKILLSGMVIPCVAFTSSLVISCGGRNESNSNQQQQEFRMPLNNYFDDTNQKIFDEDMWKEVKSLDDVNYKFIRSTVIQYPNSKYKVGFPGDDNSWIIKNKDLNFVSFYYKYWVDGGKMPTNWMVQTVYFNFGFEEGEEITFDQYWDPAETKGESYRPTRTEYKKSFESSTNHYRNQDIPTYADFKEMSQNSSNFFMMALNIIKQSFWDESVEKEFRERSQVETSYSKSSDFWKTFLVYRTNINADIVTITYLTKAKDENIDVKIKKVIKGSNKYIKFTFPPKSIKVRFKDQDYFNDFENTFYINVTNWFE